MVQFIQMRVIGCVFSDVYILIILSIFITSPFKLIRKDRILSITDLSKRTMNVLSVPQTDPVF